MKNNRNTCTDETHIWAPEHEDLKPGLYKHTCFGCGRIQHFQVKKSINEMPPTLLGKRMEEFLKENPLVLDDDVPDKFEEWITTK